MVLSLAVEAPCLFRNFQESEKKVSSRKLRFSSKRKITPVYKISQKKYNCYLLKMIYLKKILPDVIIVKYG